MAGIAGILKKNEKQCVKSMLDTISHRGGDGSNIYEFDDLTIGMVWSKHEEPFVRTSAEQLRFLDGPGDGHQAGLSRINNHWQFQRDELGVAPLYLAFVNDEVVYFASEVKALLPYSDKIVEMPPAHSLGLEGMKTTYHFPEQRFFTTDPQQIANELRTLLQKCVQKRIQSDTIGAWLSGGLDSSTIAALARPFTKTLHTFSGGLKDAPDLKYARELASYIGSVHHESIITFESIVQLLPDVIYQLESFDALLVRSSIINLTVALAASDYVSEVFSGEGGDELFAGYAYLKELPVSMLDAELLEITKSMHNTALQRVDRSASSFGTTAHVIFTDPEVFEFAMQIPVELKIKDGIEKWILRQAMSTLLPEKVLNRTKAKFWEGAGVGTLLWEYAAKHISDSDFLRERNLKNGWILNTKEELLYYRIFKEQFGEPGNLDWMGRSKGSPIFDNIGNNRSKVAL